jgi:hypothetical protein
MITMPGRYAVSNSRFARHGRYVLVEVEADGTVHQLTPKGVRDGVLVPDAWHADVRVYVTDVNERVFVRLGKPDEKVEL